MVRTTLIGLVLILGLYGCSGEHSDEPAKPSCEVMYTTCEWAALRTSDQFFAYFKLRDCSWDYGVCIGKQGETECDQWCGDIAWVPSECAYGCEAYAPTTTSTTSGE